MINNYNKFYNSKEEVFNLFRDFMEMSPDANYDARQNKAKEKGLKVLSPIALAQVKAGNNSESLLNEIRQIVYSLYHSKQITKKV